MSLIELLPGGTDVLKARVVEMAHGRCGHLSRGEVSSAQTAGALAARLLAARGRLSALDNAQPPDRVALEALAADLAGWPPASFNLGYDRPWRFLEVIAPEVLGVEARLMALEGVARVESPDVEVLERIVLEKALDGFGHRHVERFWIVLEMLVPRVLAIESRVAALEVRAASKKGAK